ncbi:BPSS1780 family membrane protein [Ideonella sp. A 288]|uniref:BPSS1780 family membrane protein n=1 Tax=Ideonella sp. A 288 TaxID=1962181 RepID=UPI000B4C0E3A|nr:BPSS1780 family membrane protein [Ideonella sp. A 288]
MGLRLHDVAPRQGAQWIRQALALWWKRPLAFVGLFMFFLFSVLLLMVVPFIGPLLGLALLPMLTLGFMIATRSALQGGPVHALQIVEGLRVPDRPRRNAQIMLCVVYALSSIGVIELAGYVDAGLFEQLQIALAKPDTPAAEVNRILADPRLSDGMLVRFGLAGLLSVPFWHAPALVHWGGQGALQAMFSSSLALWRAKGAFLVYAAGWAMITIGLGLLATAAVLMLGSRQLVSVLIMPAGLILSAMFYVSLWFSFTDSFGDDSAPD